MEDCNPRLFESLLDFLRRSTPPRFWKRDEGFGYSRYAALMQQAHYFGVFKLLDWIGKKKYEDRIRIRTSLKVVPLRDLLGLGIFCFSKSEESIIPGGGTVAER